MLSPRSVCAVIPTRGNVCVDAIYNSLRIHPEIGEVRFVIGDTPFNRYRVMLEDSDAQVFFTQDDDCVTDVREVLDAYDPTVIVNAMTPQHAENYRGAQTLIGFGAIFHRSLVEFAFRAFNWKHDALFYRESDRIFPTVNPHKTVFPAIEILPHASAPDRLWKQPDHNSARIEMNERIFAITGIGA